MNTKRYDLLNSASVSSNDAGWQQHLHHNARHRRRASKEPH
jgi:hypothetical protein